MKQQKKPLFSHLKPNGLEWLLPWVSWRDGKSQSQSQPSSVFMRPMVVPSIYSNCAASIMSAAFLLFISSWSYVVSLGGCAALSLGLFSLSLRLCLARIDRVHSFLHSNSLRFVQSLSLSDPIQSFFVSFQLHSFCLSLHYFIPFSLELALVRSVHGDRFSVDCNGTSEHFAFRELSAWQLNIEQQWTELKIGMPIESIG